MYGPIRCHGLSYNTSNDSNGSATLCLYSKCNETHIDKIHDDSSTNITEMAENLKYL